MAWVYAAAKHTGAVHSAPAGCQDAFAVALEGDVLVAAVADGAGSAPHGALGAQTASSAFVSIVVAALKRAPLGSLKGKALVGQVKQSLCQAAGARGHHPADLATTLVGAVAGPGAAFFLQVGDGAAVARPREADVFNAVGWPTDSEFVNTTTFLTDDKAQASAQVIRVSKPVGDICLTTDGLQYLVLDFRAREPHQPFFRSVCKRVGATAARGEDAEAGRWIGQMLESTPVTSKTDDDTCLLVARWRE